MSEFTKRLSDSMFRAGLTQADLADRLGITRGALNQWTSGQTFPHPANLKRCADILGVDSYWLRTGEMPEKSTTKPVGEFKDICMMFEKLLPEQKEEIRQSVLTMMKKNQQTLANLMAMYGPAVPDERVAQYLPPVPKSKEIK